MNLQNRLFFIEARAEQYLGNLHNSRCCRAPWRSSSEMKGLDESGETESDTKVNRNRNNVVYPLVN